MLVVGSGSRDYREYILEAAKTRAGLWLLNPADPTWEWPHLAGSTRVDVTDPAAAVAAAREVAAREDVRGVLCYDEALILPAAHVAEALDLPGARVGPVQACRDKHTTRVLAAQEGVPQPRSVLVRDLAGARAAAEEIGYPLVLKPRGLGASRGVVKVDWPADLDEGFAACSVASYPGVPVYVQSVLVEEFVGGPEISIDGYVFDGAYHPLFVGHKQVGLAPFFEETGHVVQADDPLLADPALLALLHDTHRALGIRQMFTHTEVKLTPHGPRLVEVNGRLGGDLIPYLGKLATGIDPGIVAVDVATGRRPAVAATVARTAAVRFLYPPYDCRVEAVEGAEQAWSSGVPEGVGDELVRVFVESGTELRLPPEGYLTRWAMLLCTGPDAETCLAGLDAAEKQLALRAVPLAGAHG